MIGPTNMVQMDVTSDPPPYSLESRIEREQDEAEESQKFDILGGLKKLQDRADELLDEANFACAFPSESTRVRQIPPEKAQGKETPSPIRRRKKVRWLS